MSARTYSDAPRGPHVTANRPSGYSLSPRDTSEDTYTSMPTRSAMHTSSPGAHMSLPATRTYTTSYAPIDPQEQPPASRREVEILIARRLKQAGQTTITASQFKRLVDDELGSARLDIYKSQNESKDLVADPAGSRHALHDRQSFPMLESVRPEATVRPGPATSDWSAMGQGGGRSISAPAPSANAAKSIGRNLLEMEITGATRDGDGCQSLLRAIKLDTASPENLISSSLRKDLRAELIQDDDYLMGANNTPLIVEGAAMVWLTWEGKFGTRKELIYCLVIRTLSQHLVVSEDKDVTLFMELREVEGPWVPSAGRSVLAIELDELTPEQREDLIRRREAALKRAREIQAEKNWDRANKRDRTAVARGEQGPRQDRVLDRLESPSHTQSR